MSLFNTINKTTVSKNKLLVSGKSLWFLLCTQMRDTSLQLATYLRVRTLIRFVRYWANTNKSVTDGSLRQYAAFTGALAGLIMLFSSCEKVIHIDLNNASEKYVIEGTVIHHQGCKVQISQTVNFSDASVYPAISGAVVTVQDDNGTPVTLAETSPGVYETNAITGKVGHNYSLSVSVSGQVFISTSQMPQQVSFDSLFVEKNSVFGDSTNLANAVFRDPAQTGNNYRFLQYKNGTQNKTIFITNDDFTNGNLNTATLRDFGNNDDDDPDELETGDVVLVEMQCIDANVYKYWYSLNQGGTGSSNNATPGNPVTNISNGALGYFSAHTVQRRSVMVQ